MLLQPFKLGDRVRLRAGRSLDGALEGNVCGVSGVAGYPMAAVRFDELPDILIPTAADRLELCATPAERDEWAQLKRDVQTSKARG